MTDKIKIPAGDSQALVNAVGQDGVIDGNDLRSVEVKGTNQGISEIQ